MQLMLPGDSMYIPKHFLAQELVPPEIYELRGQKSIELIDERVLITLDTLRETFGICTVNDWSFIPNGQFTQSGLRTIHSEDYSATSQHTFGRAMDCKFDGYSSEYVRKEVIEYKDHFPYITFIENDVSWFHFDVRNCEPITLWSPETNQATVV